MTKRVRRTLNGARGAFQFMYSLIYLVLGWSYIVVPYTPARTRAFDWLDQLVDVQLVGLLWVAAGATAFIGAFLSAPRDQYSFGMLTLVPALFGFLYLFGWVTGDTRSGWATTCLFWALAASSMIAAKGMRGRPPRGT